MTDQPQTTPMSTTPTPSNSSNNNNNTAEPPTQEGPPPTAPLQNIAGAIFVPLTEDLTKPLPVSTKTRGEEGSKDEDADSNKKENETTKRLQTCLDTLSSHCVKVQANHVALFERERARIIRQATHDDQHHATEAINPGLEKDDLREMIGCMDTPHDPNHDYNVQNIPPADLERIELRNPREWAAIKSMILADSAARELGSYAEHVRVAKVAYEEALKKERARLAG